MKRRILLIVPMVLILLVSLHSPGLSKELKTFEEYLNKGMELYKKGRYKEALIEFNTVKKLEPMFSGAYHWSGVIYSDTSDYRKALEEFKKAIKLGSVTDAVKYSHTRLGFVYKRSGELEKAIVEYKNALEVDPLYANAELDLYYACQWKYARKYTSLNEKYLTNEKIEKEYVVEEVPQEYLILHEKRHYDGGRYRLKLQTLENKDDKPYDKLITTCTKCNTEQIFWFNIEKLWEGGYFTQLAKINRRYEKALEDEDNDIRVYAVHKLGTDVGEAKLKRLLADDNKWVRFVTVSEIGKDKGKQYIYLLYEKLNDKERIVREKVKAIIKK